MLTQARRWRTPPLTNADLLVAQTMLSRDLERQVQHARRESEEKQQALEELDRKLEVIEQQRAAIRDLATPILQIWDDILALPVIGTSMSPASR